MKVYIVFKTKSNGTTWHGEVHKVCKDKEKAESIKNGLTGGYVCDYDVI